MSSSQLGRPATEGRPPLRRRGDTGSLPDLLNGALAGVGGVYLTTHSVVVTIIAAVVALMLTLLTVIHQR